MAIQKPTLPKGTRDFGPADVQKRKYILNTIETVFKKYGFMPLETPTMENLTTLEGKYGEEGDKLLFRILESGEYFEKTIIKINPELSVTIQSLMYDIFSQMIKDILHSFNDEELNNEQKIEDYLIKDINHQLVSFGSGKISEESPVIIKFVIENKEEISYEIARMFTFSGITKDSTADIIQFQIRNLRENYLNHLITRLLSKLSQIQEKISSLSSKDLTKFIAEKGLRYDLTVPFARYVVMNRNEITFPFKRYQMQPVWRADRPQKGRYREFWQCDADVVGSDSLLNEVDLILIYIEVFKNLGIPVQVKYNNRKLLDGLAQMFGIEDKLIEMTVILDKTDKIGIDTVTEELKSIGANEESLKQFLNIFKLPNLTTKHLKDFFASSNEISKKGVEEIVKISEYIEAMFGSDNNLPIMHDLALARGLSYYTGSIFEVVATTGTLKSSIGGGGRYDNLTGIFGLPNVSGVGISFGLDRIYDVMDELKLFPEQLRATSTQVLFCHFDEASQQYCLPAAKALRDNGIATEIYPDVVKKKAIAKQLDYANALQIPFAAIAGETEVEQGVFNLKNLVTGEQKAVTLTELIGTFVSA